MAKKTIPMPFTDVVPCQDTRAEILRLWREIPAQDRQRGKVRNEVRAVEARLRVLIDQGSDSELLGALSCSVLRAEEWPLSWQMTPLLAARVERFAAEKPGHWSPLVEAIYRIPGASYRIFPTWFAKHWLKWARQFETEAEYETAVAPVVAGGWTLPLETLATRGPFVPLGVARWMLAAKHWNRSRRRMLDRTDIPAQIRQTLVNEEMEPWSETRRWADDSWRVAGHAIRRAGVEPTWRPEGFESEMERLLAEAMRENGSGKMSNPVVEIVSLAARWKAGDEAFWRRVLALVEGQARAVAYCVANPEFPVSLAREVLATRATTEVRVAMVQNPVLSREKEIRLALERGGQNFSVWQHLLDSTTDPEEATRLISYMVSAQPRQVSDLIKSGRLPEGTVIPTTVMTKVMVSQGERADRVETIKQLSRIKPQKVDLPPVPKRASGARVAKKKDGVDGEKRGRKQ